MLRGFLAPILVLALLVPALSGKEGRGAQVAVTKSDGTVVRGELLAVRGTDLLIMDKSTPGGISVSLANAKLVRVVKRGKAAIILGGVALGGAAGAGLGYTIDSGDNSPLSGIGRAAWAAGGGAIGVLAGGVFGWIIASDEKFPIVASDPNSLKTTAFRLHRLARDRS